MASRRRLIFVSLEAEESNIAETQVADSLLQERIVSVLPLRNNLVMSSLKRNDLVYFCFLFSYFISSISFFYRF